MAGPLSGSALSVAAHNLLNSCSVVVLATAVLRTDWEQLSDHDRNHVLDRLTRHADVVAAGLSQLVQTGDGERAELLPPLSAQERGHPHGRRHAVGDAVELHTKFDDSWCDGFEIAEVRGDRYLVRRSHDNELLPESTSASDLRAAP